ncbi:hypothetical protein Ssi03_64360 [Sphaerisporangium siamense]|uniref:Uncharacterized protein n=1 Tax=Sphaerisporangium siamense TaxID=795645 RepID=A0A7W7G807_9ACTN|nr:hypothetical protein [Sphaerisporangium siamense]MBB4699025.1 hypothetical protein [Sphaerisporangium siamense]GII88446.1 hypothetical protein Ssi03_64360 [Sphaerisporangium siamense]
MRTSFAARGLVALAVVAGAGWAGTAGASAAVPCGEGTMTPLNSPTTVYCEHTSPGVTEPGVYGVTEPTPPRYAAPGGLDGYGGGVPAGFENAGRPSRLLSGSAAVAGLAGISDLSIETPLLSGLGVR